MPQASPALRAKFPGGDREACAVIATNFYVSRGWVIYPKQLGYGYQMTKREGDAIDYLCDEWDYAYSPTNPE